MGLGIHKVVWPGVNRDHLSYLVVKKLADLVILGSSFSSYFSIYNKSFKYRYLFISRDILDIHTYIRDILYNSINRDLVCSSVFIPSVWLCCTLVLGTITWTQISSWKVTGCYFGSRCPQVNRVSSTVTALCRPALARLPAPNPVSVCGWRQPAHRRPPFCPVICALHFECTQRAEPKMLMDFKK